MPDSSHASVGEPWRVTGGSGRRLRSVIIVVTLLAGGVGATTRPASADGPVRPLPEMYALAAVADAGHASVEVHWTGESGATYTVAEKVAGQLQPLGTVTGWSLALGAVPVGKHTYRVSGPFYDGATVRDAWLETSFTFAARQLVATGRGLGTVEPPSSNAGGLPLGDGNLRGPAGVSPDRRTLAASYFAYDGSDLALWLLTPLGQLTRQLTSGHYDTEPAFSPDARRMVFTRRDTMTGFPSLYAIDPEVPGAVAVPVPGGAGAARASWLPDGRHVLVERYADTGGGPQRRQGIDRLDTVTGGREPLSGGEGGGDPAVSRSGRVAFDRRVGDPDVGALEVVVAADANSLTQAQRWSPPPAGPNDHWQEPAWDPQGMTLAVVETGSLGRGMATVTGQDGLGLSWWGSFYSDSGPAWLDAADAAPTLSFTAPAVTPDGSVVTQVAMDDPDDVPTTVGVSCRVDTSAWEPCGNGAWSPPVQSPGEHLLTARAVDVAGQESVVSRYWTADQAGPVATLRRLPVVAWMRASELFWSADDGTGSGVANFDVRVRSGARSTALGPWTYPADLQGTTTTHATVSSPPLGGESCYQVRSRDMYDNVGAWTAPACTSRPLDDRALRRATTGWSRQTAPGYVSASRTTATRSGARLTLRHVHAAKIGVVVALRRDGGRLSVRHAGDALGTVSLQHNSAPRLRRVFWFSTRHHNGTLVLQTRNNRRVDIDAVLFVQ